MSIESKHFTLKQVADSIQKTIQDRYTQSYWVSAELYKLNPTKKGHCYPELVHKEHDQVVTEMKGVIWKNNFLQLSKKFESVLNEPFREGLVLLFLIRINFHPIFGLNIEILDVDPTFTLGALQREKQETLEYLSKNNLINANQKHCLAKFPKRIAIISQHDSKGYLDFISILENHPKKYRFQTLLFEASLNGDAAIKSIGNQLTRIEKVATHFDAVIIIRGGGAEIGMHCYNNKLLCEQIARFPLPLFTGIGHATNHTVAELIAFHNGITPTDLAYYFITIAEELEKEMNLIFSQLEMRSFQFLHEKTSDTIRLTRLFSQDVQLSIREHQKNLQTFSYNLISICKQNQQIAKNYLVHKKQIVENYSHFILKNKKKENQLVTSQITHYVNELVTKNKMNIIVDENQMHQIIMKLIEDQKRSVFEKEKLIDLVNPEAILRRGFAIVKNKNGAIDLQNFPFEKDEIFIETADYNLNTRVITWQKK